MEEREREPQPKFGLKVLVPGITAGCLIGKVMHTGSKVDNIRKNAHIIKIYLRRARRRNQIYPSRAIAHLRIQS